MVARLDIDGDPVILTIGPHVNLVVRGVGTGFDARGNRAAF
jgi:hypothetical protein